MPDPGPALRTYRARLAVVEQRLEALRRDRERLVAQIASMAVDGTRADS